MDQQECSTTLRTAAEAKEDLTATQKSTFSTLKRWLENLHDHLLHTTPDRSLMDLGGKQPHSHLLGLILPQLYSAHTITPI